MSTALPVVTADEFFHWPNDGFRRELVRGKIIVMNPSGFEHGSVVARLTGWIVRYVEEQKLGIVSGAETGFVLGHNPDTVRAPDVAFVRRLSLPRSEFRRHFFPGRPTWRWKLYPLPTGRWRWKRRPTTGSARCRNWSG